MVDDVIPALQHARDFFVEGGPFNVSLGEGEQRAFEAFVSAVHPLHSFKGLRGCYAARAGCADGTKAMLAASRVHVVELLACGAIHSLPEGGAIMHALGLGSIAGVVEFYRERLEMVREAKVESFVVIKLSH